MAASQTRLTAELQCYAKMKQQWLHTHTGSFVVIKGVGVLDFFPTFESAYKAGAAKWGVDADFLVKRITEHEPVFSVF